jgi:hypothetical protein
MTVQTHHISYDPEVTVKVYKGEHWILTQLHRRKSFSKGFVTAIKVWLAIHEESVKELEGENPS